MYILLIRTMRDSEIIQHIFQLDTQAVNSSTQYPKKRYLFNSIRQADGKPFVALIGPRGVGKTVLFRQLRSETPSSIYISADTISRNADLPKILRILNDQYSISTFFLDEIHFIADYQHILKELYDFYQIKIFFTSSVSLSLLSSSWDLSRRVILFELLPFSFREYLFIKHNTTLLPLSFNSILKQEYDAEYLRTYQWFDEYLSGGLFPFFLEGGTTLQQMEQILEKIIQSDIPSLNPDLSFAELEVIRKIIRFIGKSPVDGINYSSIARNTGITKYKAERYLSLLEKAYVILQKFPAGTNVLKEPKVLMFLPYRLLFRDFLDSIGELREDFFALAMKQHSMDFQYCKTTRGKKTPDFLINFNNKNILIEVGGRGKGYTQFKGLNYDEKLVLHHGISSNKNTSFKSIPLHLLGFS